MRDGSEKNECLHKFRYHMTQYVNNAESHVKLQKQYKLKGKSNERGLFFSTSYLKLHLFSIAAFNRYAYYSNMHKRREQYYW